MIIDIEIDSVVVHVEVDDVYHRREGIVIAGRPGCPVFAEICEHVDVVSKKVETRLSEGNGEGPLSEPIPLEGSRQMATNLLDTSMMC